jgi:ribonuclease BN (tRNA processing enzyme)
LRLREFEDERRFRLGDVLLTPIPVAHAVPTHGLLIESGGVAVLWSSDTGPTERLWEWANRTPNLKALCLDVSFSNAMQAVADESGHHTPQTLARELQKLEREVPVFLHHLKPGFADLIRSEVAELGLPFVSFLEQGRRYTF